VDLRVLVVEDVHLAADLVDLVDVVPGPFELCLDEWTPEFHGAAYCPRSQLVRALLERPQPHRGTERLPARQ